MQGTFCTPCMMRRDEGLSQLFAVPVRADITQKQRAPLVPLPMVDTPFSRVAMDIVGHLRKTKKGKRFILVIMDYNTAQGGWSHCPQHIDRRPSPENLWTVLQDQNTQRDPNRSRFELCIHSNARVLQAIQRETISLPPADSYRERFNSTLKQMLRKRWTRMPRIGISYDHFFMSHMNWYMAGRWGTLLNPLQTGRRPGPLLLPEHVGILASHERYSLRWDW